VASNTSYIAANSNLVAGAVQNVSGSAPSSVSIYGPDLVSIASQLEVTLTSLDDINFLSGGTLYLGADTAVNFQVSRLTNIADPSSPNDLADLGYNDARYYNSSGETKLVLTGGYITISNGAFYIYTN